MIRNSKTVFSLLAIAAASLALSCVGFAQEQPVTKEDKASVKMTMSAAKKMALAKHPGKVTSAELEKENNVLQYSFDIKTSEGMREVGINAITGDIVEDKLESKADEMKEAKADAAETAAKAKKDKPKQ